MCIGSGRDVDDNLGVGFGESGDERRAEECVHAFRAAPFVAVVEIEAFALEDECTYAVLGG